jgi:hypothetical protein
MSKRYNIRWTESDKQELRRTVKNFNAKISRLEKKDPQNKNALPEKMTVKALEELIDTRQDLKRELNSLQRFTKRGAEEIIAVPENDYNLKITKWQKEEMTRRTAVINQKRQRRLDALKEVEMKSGGENLGYTVGQFGMGKAEEISLRPMKPFSTKMNTADLKKKFKHILKESQSNYFNRKDELLRENYIKGLKQNYNEDDVADIIEAIEDMEFNEFYSTYQAEGGTMEFASIKPSKREYDGYVNQLKAQWKPNK